MVQVRPLSVDFVTMTSWRPRAFPLWWTNSHTMYTVPSRAIAAAPFSCKPRVLPLTCATAKVGPPSWDEATKNRWATSNPTYTSLPLTASPSLSVGPWRMPTFATTGPDQLAPWSRDRWTTVSLPRRQLTNTAPDPLTFTWGSYCGSGPTTSAERAAHGAPPSPELWTSLE